MKWRPMTEAATFRSRPSSYRQQNCREKFRYNACGRPYREGSRRPDLVNALRDHDAPLGAAEALCREVQAEASAFRIGDVI